MRLVFLGMVLAASAAALVACSDGGGAQKGSGDAANSSGAVKASATAAGTESEPPTPPIPAPAAQPSTSSAAGAPAAPPAPAPTPEDPQEAAINNAGLTTPSIGAWKPGLVRAQVLLARARFSPGVIDGQEGGNFKKAVSTFEAAHKHPADGKLDAEMWSALTSADPGPVVTSYVISAADVAGPFSPVVPSDDIRALSKLDHAGYTSPQELLAERFRMDEGLLKALNPGADFGVAGTRILVAAFPSQAPSMAVRSIEVDKAARQVRAFDAQGVILAAYPATVGSTERPAPTGEYKVKGVAHDPTYTYDPRRLTYGDRSLGKLTIKPGPNNPVGVVWIDLSIPTYGIHGAPDPALVGKVASHGCVRMTNWDALDLAAGVKPGVKVVFVGADRPLASRRGRRG